MARAALAALLIVLAGGLPASAESHGKSPHPLVQQAADDEVDYTPVGSARAVEVMKERQKAQRDGGH